jgi:DNA-binding response OmpR family regulator
MAWRTPEAVLLEGNFPDIDAEKLCRQARRLERHLPIIMFSATASVQERVKGLNAGADYYLLKPLDAAEIGARLRALVRRNNVDMRLYQPYTPPGLRFAELELDHSARSLVVGNARTPLSPCELALLELFLRNAERTLSYEEIRKSIWPHTPAGSAIVRVYVYYLRKRIREAGGQQLIETVDRCGYTLRLPNKQTNPGAEVVEVAGVAGPRFSVHRV